MLGRRLAEARLKAGLSQAKLAELMGTVQPAIAYWERNAQNLRSDVLARAAKILDVSADELLSSKNKRPRASKISGKMRRLFDAVSKLPRRQQEKVFAILAAFVARYARKTSPQTPSRFIHPVMSHPPRTRTRRDARFRS